MNKIKSTTQKQIDDLVTDIERGKKTIARLEHEIALIQRVKDEQSKVLNVIARIAIIEAILIVLTIFYFISRIFI